MPRSPVQPSRLHTAKTTRSALITPHGSRGRTFGYRRARAGAGSLRTLWLTMALVASACGSSNTAKTMPAWPGADPASVEGRAALDPRIAAASTPSIRAPPMTPFRATRTTTRTRLRIRAIAPSTRSTGRAPGGRTMTARPTTGMGPAPIEWTIAGVGCPEQGSDGLARGHVPRARSGRTLTLRRRGTSVCRRRRHFERNEAV
jgi:hypothetical protein